MQNNTISYIEFKCTNIEDIKKFYSTLFDWKFTDFGPDYTSFAESGVMGGFEKTEGEVVSGVLVVLYYDNLEEILEKVQDAGGKISKEIFEFPGGRRFHFIDPSGNELAIWSDK